MNLGHGDEEPKFEGVSIRCTGCPSCYPRQHLQPLFVQMTPIAELGFEHELATKTLKIQSKRYYLDVKENSRGRFMKIAEISADGRRSQVFLALSTAAEFRNHLSAFSAYYASLGPIQSYNVFENDKLKSEMMFKDTRRYYLDLKENEHGRFLRLSQSVTKSGTRFRIAIPAQGMIEMRDAITDLLEEFGTNDGGMYPLLPEERHLKVDKKSFYFDVGQNKRGVYMRISELTNNYRNAITMPEKGWEAFRDILIDYCEKLKQLPHADYMRDSTDDDTLTTVDTNTNTNTNTNNNHNNNHNNINTNNNNYNNTSNMLRSDVENIYSDNNLSVDFFEASSIVLN